MIWLSVGLFFVSCCETGIVRNMGMGDDEGRKGGIMILETGRIIVGGSLICVGK